MHKMENTPRIVTIIGLVIEGIYVLTLLSVSIFILKLNSFPGFESAEAEMTVEEYADFMLFIDFFGYIILGVAIFVAVFFIVNLILFTGLMRGKYSEETAKSIYLYQAIWGGVNLLSNQITGILYLVSGVQGYNGRKDSVDVREGI